MNNPLFIFNSLTSFISQPSIILYLHASVHFTAIQILIKQSVEHCVQNMDYIRGWNKKNNHDNNTKKTKTLEWQQQLTESEENWTWHESHQWSTAEEQGWREYMDLGWGGGLRQLSLMKQRTGEFRRKLKAKETQWDRNK